MTEEHPRVRAYMSQFEATLRKHGLKESADIARDVRSHIAEAIDYGKPIDAILDSFGPPEALARAYAVELLMDKPAGSRGAGIGQFLQLLGLLAAGGIATFVIVLALGSIGVGFALSGVLLIVIGAIEAMGVHLPHVQTADLPPLLIMALGPVFLALAWGAFWTLSKYAGFIAGVWRRAAPRGGPAIV